MADNDLVHVFSFDFSIPFDMVRHASLMSKLAQLALPDSVYNWAVDFFEKHAHNTKFAETISAVAIIHASVIQGSALGQASYIVTAADLHPIHEQNRIFKFVDDTYLIVPAVNTDTCQEEIQHLQTWVADNNLKLNRDKTKEIIFTASRKQAPPPRRDIERVSTVQPTDPWRYREWQAYRSLPRKCLTIVKFQSAVCHASAARTRHADHVAAWHILCHNRRADPICSASVVGNVFGCWPRVSIRYCVALNGSGTPATTSQPSLTCSTLPMTTFFTALKVTLTTSSSHTHLRRLTYHTSFAPALTISLINKTILKLLKFLHS